MIFPLAALKTPSTNSSQNFPRLLTRSARRGLRRANVQKKSPFPSSHVLGDWCRIWTRKRGFVHKNPIWTLLVVHTYIHIHTFIDHFPKGTFQCQLQRKKIKIKTYTNYLKIQLQIIRISFLPLKFV